MTAAELREIGEKLATYARFYRDDRDVARMSVRCLETAELLDRANKALAIEPILGGPPVTEGRVWQPEDTDKATGPFVIGKLAQDSLEAPTSVDYGEPFPTDQA